MAAMPADEPSVEQQPPPRAQDDEEQPGTKEEPASDEQPEAAEAADDEEEEDLEVCEPCGVKVYEHEDTTMLHCHPVHCRC
eukprot:6819773-Pyramimonas_sp.AAC.1